MGSSRTLFLTFILFAVWRPVIAEDSPKILGELRTSSTADSLHVDFDVFVNDRVDSLLLDLWNPVRIFAAGEPEAGAVEETLRVHSPFLTGESGLFVFHLKGRRSWPRLGRGDPSRIWLEYWGGEGPNGEPQAKRKFWELNEISLGFSIQPLIIIGSSFNYHDPEVEGLDRQSSYLESLFLGLHVNYGRWRLTIGEGGGAGHFYGETDSTEQDYEFMTGAGPYLRHDLGDLTRFRPIVGAGWHRFDLQMRGPTTTDPVAVVDRKEDGFGLTLGLADPAGTLTYSYLGLDLEHYRHLISLSLPVMGFKRSSFGTRIDYVEVDGRPAWKTHFVFEVSTPLFPKDGPLITPEDATWTWRNYTALALAGAAEPLVLAFAVIYLGIRGIGALF